MLLALEMEVMSGKVAALDQDWELKRAPLPLLEGKLLVLGHKRTINNGRSNAINDGRSRFLICSNFMSNRVCSSITHEQQKTPKWSTPPTNAPNFSLLLAKDQN